jgi:hypothetical protein
MGSLTWIPQWTVCLHWPFCPGVFIAFMGLLAAAVTFWKDPPRPIKAICVLVFFVLTICEIWMMSKDRYAHDEADKSARKAEQQVSDNISLLIAAVSSGNSTVSSLKSELQAAEKARDTVLAAKLGAQIAAAQTQVNNASKQLLLTLVSRITQEMEAASRPWNIERVDMERKLTGKTDISHYYRDSQLTNIDVEYSAKVRPTMITANELRIQLLKLLPSIPASELTDRWKAEKAYQHTIMPYIEAAYIGPLPRTTFKRAFRVCEGDSVLQLLFQSR